MPKNRHKLIKTRNTIMRKKEFKTMVDTNNEEARDAIADHVFLKGGLR